MLVACGGAGAAIVARDRRIRHSAMVVALVAAPVLIAGDVWNQDRIVDLRTDPIKLAAAAVGGTAVVGGLATAFLRFDWAFPVAAFAAIALRLPIQLGEETSNLLIPLYFVIASGVAASIWRSRERRDAVGSGSEPRVVRWLRLALAATLILYGIQSAYSEDVSNAVENAGFFLVPFGVLFALLAEVPWTRRLLGLVLATVTAAGLTFAAVGIGEYLVRDLWLNPDLLDSNQIHLYFRVNSLFRDPNVYGRYLALAIIALAAFCAYSGRPRLALAAAAAAAIQLVGLALSFSISSIGALLVGLLVITALRFGWRWGAFAAVATVAAAGLFAAIGGADRVEQGPDRGLEAEASGRVELFEGGTELFELRPGWGYGSGSFGNAYANHVEPSGATSSHAEPLTVASEQGLIGLLAYAATLALAAVVLFAAGARADPARCALAAAFVAVCAHSLGYAAFATDPITWAVLGLGIGLRRAAPAR
jgi:O-antigen ligase